MHSRSFQIDACQVINNEREFLRCENAWKRRFGYDEYWLVSELKRCNIPLKANMDTYILFQTATDILDPDMEYLTGIPIELEDASEYP